MTTDEERLKILEMVANGQISADEGAQLLTATSKVPAPPPPPKPETPLRFESREAGSKNGRRLRVVVMSKNGKERVNVNLPIRLMEIGLKIGGRFVDELKDLDEEMEMLMDAIQNDVTGKIIEVDDEEEHVEIFIE